MNHKKPPKRELILGNLINEPRVTMNLLVVGREDKDGVFPNNESNFMLRKLTMVDSKHRGYRGSQLFEMTIPRACARNLQYQIARTINNPALKIQEHEFADAETVEVPEILPRSVRDAATSSST